jgi:hypothetical protein
VLLSGYTGGGAKGVALAPFVSVLKLFWKDFEKERSTLRVVSVSTQNKTWDHNGLERGENIFDKKDIKEGEEEKTDMRFLSFFPSPRFSELDRNIFERNNFFDFAAFT